MIEQHQSTPNPGGPATGRRPSIGGAQRRALADDLYRQARVIRQSERERLKELAEQSLELACQADESGEAYSDGVANALSMLAYLDASTGHSEAALSRGAQALSLLDTSEPSVVLGDIYDAMGWALFTQGAFVEAIEVLVKALRIAEDIGDRELEAFALDTMATVNCATGRTEEALEGHLKALAIAKSIGNDLHAAVVSNNMAYAYLATGDNDAALEAALAALRHVQERGLIRIRVAVLDTIAAVYLARTELDTASEYAETGLKLARTTHCLSEECDILMTLGQISLKRGENDVAFGQIEQALALAGQTKRSVEEYTCHELLARIHERQGEMAAALAEYHAYHSLERRRFNQENESRLAHLRVEHQLDSARKDAEIHRLRTLALEREVEQQRIVQAGLEARASLDPLTGLYNRRHLTVIERELLDALDRSEPACLLMLDIDHFKAINDTYGHLAGDHVLANIAALLCKHFRANDIPCRYGGDEFLVLLAGMDTAAGIDAAERFRAAVAESFVEFEGRSLRCTISIGVTCAGTRGDLATLIAEADGALYAAKQSGRNRVVPD